MIGNNGLIAKRSAILKDNIEDIKHKIEINKHRLLYVVLRNPEPCGNFVLKYKMGTDYYSYAPWYKQRVFNPFAKRNYIISENIYGSYVKDQNNRINLVLYREDELCDKINNPRHYVSWAQYLWRKDKTPNTPVWYNYSIDLVWANNYNNSSYSTRIYLINHNGEENQRLVNEINDEYAIHNMFKIKAKLSLSSVLEELNDNVSSKLNDREKRWINIIFIKNRIKFLLEEIDENINKDVSVKKIYDNKEEIMMRQKDFMSFKNDQIVNLIYDDYPEEIEIIPIF